MSDAATAIANLVYEYAERIDAGDFDGVAELFAGAVITTEGVAGERRGRDAVREMYVATTRRYPGTGPAGTPGTPLTKHVATNLIVEVDEAAGTASCRSYFVVLQQTATLPLQAIITGRYRDTFRREGGRWRFASRHMICDQLGDLSQHLLFDASRLARRGDS